MKNKWLMLRYSVVLVVLVLLVQFQNCSKPADDSSGFVIPTNNGPPGPGATPTPPPPGTPACTAVWNAPTFATGEGQRKAGTDYDNVKINFKDLAAGKNYVAQFRFTNVASCGLGASTTCSTQFAVPTAVGGMSVLDKTQVSTRTLIPANFSGGNWTIDVLEAGSTTKISSCSGFVVSPPPTCVAQWGGNKNAGTGAGIRVPGVDYDNVKLTFAGLTPNAPFYVRSRAVPAASCSFAGNDYTCQGVGAEPFIASAAGTYTLNDLIGSGSEVVLPAHWSYGNWNTDVLDGNGNIISTCTGFSLTPPPTIACDILWAGNSNALTKQGIRKVGDKDNLKISITGLVPGGTYYLRDRNFEAQPYSAECITPDNIICGGVGQFGADGAGKFSIDDTGATMVTIPTTWKPGTWAVDILNANKQLVGGCIGFIFNP